MSSWVIVEKSSEKAVFETFNKTTADKVREKSTSHMVVPIMEWLAGLNETIKKGKGNDDAGKSIKPFM